MKLTPKLIGCTYLLLVPIFGGIYWFFDSLWGKSLGLIESFYFSAITITTLGYGDIYPITDIGRVLTAMEALLGIVLIGLFMNSISEHRAELQEKERHDSIVEHLLGQYKNFRMNIVEIFLRATIGGYNSERELKEKLTDMMAFREYFNAHEKEKWYVALNALDDDERLLQDLFVEIDMFSEQVTFALNNTSVNDHETLRFLTKFSQHPYRLKNLDVYADDKVKYISGFILEVMSGWSTIEGYRDYDVFFDKFNNL